MTKTNPSRSDSIDAAPFFAHLVQNGAILLVAFTLGGLLFTSPAEQAWNFLLSLWLGSALASGSFWLLRRSVPQLLRADDLASRPDRETRRARRRAVFEFLIRYVVIAAMAYWGITRAKFHAGALALGFTVPIFAVMIEGIRMLVEKKDRARGLAPTQTSATSAPKSS